MPEKETNRLQPDNAEILKSVKHEQGDALEEESSDVTYKKFLIFMIGKKKFAVEAFLVREIVLDLKIFFIPFVPPYIRGVVNRHGDPYTVIDLNVLFYQEKLEANTFLMLSDIKSPASFLISDVVEIIKVPVSQIDLINDVSDDQNFFRGAVKNGDDDILILEIDEIFSRLKKDVS